MPSPRILQPEWMDRDDIDPALHRQALVGLARLNMVSGSAGILWSAMRGRLFADRPTTLLDVATGSGDVPRALARRAKRAGLQLSITACDRSDVALDEARRAARLDGFSSEGPVSFQCVRAEALDVHSPEGLPTGPFDIVTCSLFLHHLTDAEAVSLLAALALRTRHLLLVNDLDRGWWGHFVVRLGSFLLTRSPVVRFDGPASMGGAFTRAETWELAARAGLDGATVGWRWPCRWLLEHHRA